MKFLAYIFVYVVSTNDRVHIESVSLQVLASVRHAVIAKRISDWRINVQQVRRYS